MEFLIRNIDEKDITGVVEVENLSFPLPWSYQSFVGELNNRLARYLVAESENKVIGYIGMWHIIDEGHITNVAVHPDYRNMGIGNALIDKMLGFARENKLAFVMLEVRVGNVQARRIYERFGFVEQSQRKGYYRDNGEDAIVMICRLPGKGN